MDIKQLELLTCGACSAAERAAEFIRGEAGKVVGEQIEEKFLNGLVSYVDKTAEHILVEDLSKLLPEASFITEEGTVDTEETFYHWIIDPLDGTTNFLYNIPHYSVSVGLKAGDDILLGVIVHVPNRETYYAWKNGGAYCNGKPIKVSSRAHMRESLIATGFPYSDFDRADAWVRTINVMMQSSRGLRRFASAALDMAFVACGRFDAFFEYGLSAWDVAGGKIIVEEAGGKVTDFKGGENWLFGGELLATNGLLYEEIFGVVEENMQ